MHDSTELVPVLPAAGLVLFVRPACPACAEADVLVPPRVPRLRVVPGHEPGLAVIVDGPRSPVVFDAELVPAFPALWCGERKILAMGVEAIERLLLELGA